MKTRRFTVMLLVIALLTSSNLFAFSLPFFGGFDAEKESGNLIDRIVKGDYKGLAEDIDDFNTELMEEISEKRSEYQKDLAKLEEKGESASEKMWNANSESQFERYANQLEEIMTEYEEIEDEMESEIDVLSAYEITDSLVYKLIVSNADTEEKAWKGAEFMFDARGIMTAYAAITYEGAGRSWTVDLDEDSLKSHTVDITDAVKDIESLTGGRMKEVRDASGKAVASLAKVALDTPWGQNFTVMLDIDVTFDMNGLDGTTTANTVTMDIADDIDFPEVEGTEGRMFLGWAKTQTSDSSDSLYEPGAKGVTVAQTGAGATFYAQYAKFDVTAQIQDLEGNRNGVAQIGEKITIVPVIANNGTLPVSFTLDITEGSGDGFSVTKAGRPSISYKNLEPGESVMVTGNGTYTGRTGEALGGRNWNRSLARDRYDIQISRTTDAGTIEIPATITSAGESLDINIPLTIEEGKFFTRIGVWEIDDKNGNGDGRLNPGEEVGFDFALGITSNSDDAYDVSIQVTASDPSIKVTGGAIGEVGDLDEDHVYIARGVSYAQLKNLRTQNLSADRSNAIRISVPDDVQVGSNVVISVKAVDNLGLESVNTITIPVQTVDGNVRLRNWDWEVDEGNNDDVFNCGETASVGYNIENDGKSLLEDVVLTFNCEDESVTLKNTTIRSATLRKDNCIMPGAADTRDFAGSTRTSNTGALKVTLPKDWNADEKPEVTIKWNLVSKNCPDGGWSGEFRIPVSNPANEFKLVDYGTFIGGEEAMYWAMPAGSTFSIDFTLLNDGHDYINDVAVSWESENDHLTITGQQRARARSIANGWYLKYSQMSSSVIKGNLRENDEVQFTISPDTPEGEVITVTAVVTDGWQIWRFPMEITVINE